MSCLLALTVSLNISPSVSSILLNLIFFHFLLSNYIFLSELICHVTVEMKSLFLWFGPWWTLCCLCCPQVVLVFPGPAAVSVQDMMQCLLDRADSRSRDFGEPSIKRLRGESAQAATQSPEEPKEFPLQRVVFIDSTWNQTNKISTDERLQGNHDTECV